MKTYENKMENQLPIVFHILVFNSISGIDIQSIGKTHYIIHVTPISSFRVLYSQT